VIIEALASGVPVLTTRLAGASVAVRPGRTGLILEDPYDVHELAELLDRRHPPIWRLAGSRDSSTPTGGMR